MPADLMNTVDQFSKKRVLFVILKHMASRKRMVACAGHGSVPLIDGNPAHHLPLIDMAGIVSELGALYSVNFILPSSYPHSIIVFDFCILLYISDSQCMQ